MKRLRLLILSLAVLLCVAGTAGAFSYEYYSGGQFFGDGDSALFGFDLAYSGNASGSGAPGLSPANDIVLSDTLGDPVYDLTSSYFKVVLSANPTPPGTPTTPTGNLTITYESFSGLGQTYNIFSGLVDTTGTFYFNLGSDVLDALRDPYGQIFLSANSDLYLTEVGIAVQPVPVPPAVLLLGTGLVGLFALKRRKAAS